MRIFVCSVLIMGAMWASAATPAMAQTRRCTHEFSMCGFQAGGDAVSLQRCHQQLNQCIAEATNTPVQQAPSVPGQQNGRYNNQSTQTEDDDWFYCGQRRVRRSELPPNAVCPAN